MQFTEAPKPLIDCTLHNESSALEVNCIPGSDSGLPQHFLLEVRGSLVGSEVIQASQTLQVPQSDQGELGEGPPIYRIENSLPSFQLDYLEPGYDYTLAIYAVNKHGRSNPKRLRNVRIVEQLGNNMERSGGFVIKNLQSIIPNSATRNMIIYVAVICKFFNKIIIYIRQLQNKKFILKIVFYINLLFVSNFLYKSFIYLFLTSKDFFSYQ